MQLILNLACCFNDEMDTQIVKSTDPTRSGSSIFPKSEQIWPRCVLKMSFNSKKDLILPREWYALIYEHASFHLDPLKVSFTDGFQAGLLSL